jgi:hypothetical protein
MLNTHQTLQVINLSKNNFSQEEHQQLIQFFRQSSIKQVTMKEVLISPVQFQGYTALITESKDLFRFHYEKGILPEADVEAMEKELKLN